MNNVKQFTNICHTNIKFQIHISLYDISLFGLSSLRLSKIAFSWGRIRRYDVVGPIDLVGVVKKTEIFVAMRDFRLYWYVTQSRLVVSCGRFGTTYRSHLHG